MKSKIREKILKEIKNYNNNDFIEVCEMEDEYSLEFLLVYLWQNGSWTINRDGGYNTIKEFDKLFIKNEKMKLYKGIQISLDEKISLLDISKIIEEIYNRLKNKYLSFTSDFNIANSFANNNTTHKYSYNIIVSCEEEEYIDTSKYRDIGESEFIIKPKGKYKIESIKLSENIMDDLPSVVIINNNMSLNLTKNKKGEYILNGGRM